MVVHTAKPVLPEVPAFPRPPFPRDINKLLLLQGDNSLWAGFRPEAITMPRFSEEPGQNILALPAAKRAKPEKAEDPFTSIDPTASKVSAEQKKAIASAKAEGVKLSKRASRDKHLAVTEVEFGGKKIAVTTHRLDQEEHARLILRAVSALGGTLPQYFAGPGLKRRQLEHLTPEQTLVILRAEKDGAQILDIDKPLPVMKNCRTNVRYRGESYIVDTPLHGEEHSRLVADMLLAIRDAVQGGQKCCIRRRMLGIDFRITLDNYGELRHMISQAEFAGITLSLRKGKTIAAKKNGKVLGTFPVEKDNDVHRLIGFLQKCIDKNTSIEWRAAQSLDAHQTEVHHAPRLTKKMLAQARAELKAAGVPRKEIELRLSVLKNVRDGKMYFPEPSAHLPEVRNPKYWQLNADGCYVPKGSAVEAVRDLWETKNAMQCYKYSSIILLKAMIDTATPEQLKTLDYLLAGKEIPAVLPQSGSGLFFKRKEPRNGKSFRTKELLPGDQIWFYNPYFSRLSAADREKPRYTGEQGSNVFYIGGGKVMTIYGGRVLSIPRYQRHMFGWNSVHDRDRKKHPHPSRSEFEICGRRSPDANWAGVNELAAAQMHAEGRPVLTAMTGQEKRNNTFSELTRILREQQKAAFSRVRGS